MFIHSVPSAFGRGLHPEGAMLWHFQVVLLRWPESLQGRNSKIWTLEMLSAEAMRDRYQEGPSQRHKHSLTHLTWIYWEVLHSGWYWAKNFIPSYRKTWTNFLTNPINSWNSCPPRAETCWVWYPHPKVLSSPSNGQILLSLLHSLLPLLKISAFLFIHYSAFVQSS